MNRRIARLGPVVALALVVGGVVLRAADAVPLDPEPTITTTVTPTEGSNAQLTSDLPRGGGSDRRPNQVPESYQREQARETLRQMESQGRGPAPH